MSIEKRGPNTWRVGIQVETEPGVWKWVRQTLHYDPELSEARQRKAARIAEAELIEQVQAGNRRPRTEVTLSELVGTFMLRHGPQLAPTTLHSYQSMLRVHILPELGALTYRELTPVRLTAWLDDLRTARRASQRVGDPYLSRSRTPSDIAKQSKTPDKGLSQRTLQHYYDTLFTVLDKCVQWELIDRNPMERVDRPKARKTPVNYLNEEDAMRLVALINQSPDIPFRSCVQLALLCGLRLGEVTGLKLSDVDFRRGTIDITRARKYDGRVGDTKTETSARLISLPPAMLATLQLNREEQQRNAALLAEGWRGDGWIAHGWDGAPLNHDTPSKQFTRFAERNGFGHIRFHDLRHTHATILLANNIDPVAVAARLGHSDATTTLRTYAHALRRRDDDAAAVLQSLIDASAPPASDPD